MLPAVEPLTEATLKKRPQTKRSMVLTHSGRLILLTASFMVGAQVTGIAAVPPVSAGVFDVGVVVGLILIAVGDFLALR